VSRELAKTLAPKPRNLARTWTLTIVARDDRIWPNRASDVVAHYATKVRTAPQIRYTALRLVRIVPFRSRIAR